MRRAARQSGLTLIELLTVMIIFMILLGATTQAYVSAIRFEERSRTSGFTKLEIDRFEDRLRTLIGEAILRADETDQTSYMTTGQDVQVTVLGAPSLAFTSLGEGLPMSYLEATGTFEELNGRFGPRGGITEMSISTSAVGDAAGAEGVFLRTQLPPDEDWTQGGNESLLTDLVSDIGFEFFDGTQWLEQWDTTQAGQHLLPQTVRVNYRLKNDPDNETHTIYVRPLYADPQAAAAAGGAPATPAAGSPSRNSPSQRRSIR